ncbi:hypothetical protein WJX72_010640 [[Myrmecia] bisecta]|uniref:Uncharacterized protein n=1 Tax=[Myrmecia] bisecta TaxID=41462 RepID=A0AAW1PZC5_9CHLO
MPLQCARCHALYYDCVKLSCGDRFCRFCIAPSQDCVLCGADIKVRESDKETQSLVDAYIEAHSNEHTVQEVDGKAVVKTDELPVSGASKKAAFFLQQGLRAFAGGNHPSALTRLSLCKEELLKNVAEGGYNTELCCQLGAVCGSQGDCCRYLGQPDAAASCYQESVRHLKESGETNLEVAHALSVSLNKLGDLQHWCGDLAAARTYYAEGLQVRRDAVGSAAAGDESLASLKLDLAVSLTKVADAEQALDKQDAAHKLFKEALELVVSIKDAMVEAPPASHAKWEQLHRLLGEATA